VSSIRVDSVAESPDLSKSAVCRHCWKCTQVVRKVESFLGGQF